LEHNIIANKSIKAQFWSFDVIFAMVIFILALTILGFTWYGVNNQLALGYSGGATVAQVQAHSLAQSLLSPGSPTNWQSVAVPANTATWTNVSVGLGTSYSGSNLSASKLYALMAMASQNYQATKYALGVSYEYYISIYGGSIDINIGRNPASHGALSTYVEKRGAFLGGTPVTMQVDIWTNTTLAIS
jgi:hypothetical protein